MNFNSLVKYATAFANSGTRTTIPEIGDYGRASRLEGFPPENEGLGAQPPLRTDMNGVINGIDEGIIAFFFGKVFLFDASLSAAGGGYPSGAVVVGNDGVTLWLSLHDDNVTDPNTIGQTNWIIINPITLAWKIWVDDFIALINAWKITVDAFMATFAAWKITVDAFMALITQSTIRDETANRGLLTVASNNTGRDMYVSVMSASATTLTLNIGGFDVSSTSVWTGSSTETLTACGVVPNGVEYMAYGDGHIYSWTEVS